MKEILLYTSHVRVGCMPTKAAATKAPHVEKFLESLTSDAYMDYAKQPTCSWLSR